MLCSSSISSNLHSGPSLEMVFMWSNRMTHLRASSKSLAPEKILSLIFGLFALFVAPLWAQNAAAQDSNQSLFSPTRQYLFGDWGGARTNLAEKGITFDIFYITDLQANPSGGLQQAQAGWERTRGTVDIDFDKMLQWQGLSFHATGLWQGGVNLGGKIGTIANPTSLVSAHTTRLDSFWLQQLFFDNRLRVRVGQLAGLDFYGNSDFGANFLIEPLGYAFGNLFANVYESFNPAGTPGAEIRVAPTKHFYLQSAVMAGNRNPYQQDPTGTHFQISDNPDFLFEAGYLTASKTYPGDYRFGGVYNGGKFSNPAGQQSSGNYLIYGIATQALYRPDAGLTRGIDASIGFDYSPGDVTRQNLQVTGEAVIHAPFASRQKDTLNFGFVYSKISDPFAQYTALLGGPALGAEKAFEVNYGLQIRPYLLFQPTFQYYVRPGANAAIPNAPVLGFRTKVTF
jgi:porin